MECNHSDKLQEELPDAPRQLQDGTDSTTDQLEVINIGDEGSPRPISISSTLREDEHAELVNLLKEYQDIFAWTYEEMPGLDEKLVTHHLHIKFGSKPIKQSPRKFRHDVEEQIKTEIQKLLTAGFIKTIHHPTWLANVVPVENKSGQIRCYVDFRDLNKCCPKDDFPLPNIDMLVDATSGHGMFSFMDGYNQIKMYEHDANKTAFRTPLRNFYYTVMPFGLENAGATYQRAMTAIFHDMIAQASRRIRR